MHNDSWFGADKVLHLFVSMALVIIIGAVLSSWCGDGLALLLAAVAALTVGIVKEAWDASHGGWFSLRDLAADGVGMVLAILLITVG